MRPLSTISIVLAFFASIATSALAAPAAPETRQLDPPPIHAPIPLVNRAGRVAAAATASRAAATMSGTLLRQSSATTTWFLYPGACAERAGGTWAARTTRSMCP